MSEHQYKKIILNKNVLDLRNAIITQACRDYVKSSMYLRNHPNNPKGKAAWLQESVRRWFLSDRFKQLGTLHSGEWFIEQLDMQVQYLWNKKIKNAKDFTRAREIEKYGESEYKKIRHRYRYKVKEMEDE